MDEKYINPRVKKKVEDSDYWGYDLHQIINSYIVKYYYGDLTNFAVSWEYYLDLVEGRLDDEFISKYVKAKKELERTYKTFEKKAEKQDEKLIRLFDNVGIDMIDNNMYYLTEEIKEDHELIFIWRSQRDDLVCKECISLNGRRFRHLRDIPERHPNCRCEILVWIDGKEFTNLRDLDII